MVFILYMQYSLVMKRVILNNGISLKFLIDFVFYFLFHLLQQKRIVVFTELFLREYAVTTIVLAALIIPIIFKIDLLTSIETKRIWNFRVAKLGSLSLLQQLFLYFHLVLVESILLLFKEL